MIVGNLLYIFVSDLYLSEGDVCFELKSVLVVGSDGFDDICQIVVQVLQYLLDEGWLLFEYGYD